MCPEHQRGWKGEVGPAHQSKILRVLGLDQRFWTFTSAVTGLYPHFPALWYIP